jgi:hypothetical protein
LLWKAIWSTQQFHSWNLDPIAGSFKIAYSYELRAKGFQNCSTQGCNEMQVQAGNFEEIQAWARWANARVNSTGD